MIVLDQERTLALIFRTAMALVHYQRERRHHINPGVWKILTINLLNPKLDLDVRCPGWGKNTFS